MLKRDSSNIYIAVFDVTTPILWDGIEPNFTGIEEPTLSILQSVWEAEKNNIEIIPDPELIPTIINPDWDGLTAKVLGGDLFTLFSRVTAESFNSLPIFVASTHINLAVLNVRIEQSLAAGLGMLTSSGFAFTQEEKQLWNNALQELGFSAIAKL